MKTKKLFTTLALLTSSLLAIESSAVNILNESNSKVVGNVYNTPGKLDQKIVANKIE